jgi:hypothetical protein
MHKIIFVTIILCHICAASVFCQDEEITLTTYYPAPYGDYDALSVNYLDLNPTDYDESSGLTPALLAGRIFYDSNTQVFKFSSDGATWRELGSGGDGIEVRYESEGDPDDAETGDMWIIVPDPA